MNFLKYLSFFDLFKIPVIFYFEGNSKRFSGLGIFFSLTIYTFLLLQFTQSNLFLKNAPIVVTQSIQTPHANLVHFKNNTLIIFNVADASARLYLDPSIFTVVFKYYTDPLHFEYFELKQCEERDVDFNQTLFQHLKLKNSLCLNDINKTFKLEGSWDDFFISYAAVSLFLCNNLTSYNTCKSSEEIDKFFNTWSSFKFFSVTFHNSQVDLADYNNPFKITYRTDFQFIDTSVKKRFNIFLKTAEVETDDGWIFPEKKVEKNFMFDTKEFDFQMRSDKTQPVFQMLFYASKEVVKSSRRYQKLPEALGSLIGMAHLLKICLIFVTGLATHVSMLNNILNKIYFFQKIEKKKCKIKRNKKKTLIRTFDVLKKEGTELNKLGLKSPDKVRSHNISSEPKNTLKDISPLNKLEDIILKEEIVEKALDAPITVDIHAPLPLKQNEHTLKEDSFILDHYSQEFDSPKVDNIISHDKNQQKTMITTQKPKLIEEINIKEKLKSNFKTNHTKKLSSQDEISAKTEKVNESDQNKLEKKSAGLITHEESTVSKKRKNGLFNFQNFRNKTPQKVENSLNLSYWEYLWYYIHKMTGMKKTPKQNLIYKSEKIYENEMDIVMIITKLHNLEKLKMILLDEDQLALFNCLNKPIISISNQEEFTNNIIASQLRMTKLISQNKMNRIDVEKCYKKILINKDGNDVNERLLEYFDKNSISIFNEE